MTLWEVVSKLERHWSVSPVSFEVVEYLAFQPRGKAIPFQDNRIYLSQNPIRGAALGNALPQRRTKSAHNPHVLRYERFDQFGLLIAQQRHGDFLDLLGSNIPC